MMFVAALAGYLVGTLPTAGWIAGAKGIDLREGGSGNPGANNARKLGGLGLAAAVLLVEITKGLVAAGLGEALAGDGGAVVAGVSAIAGNIYNVWYRFAGGKGLGITAGVLLATWPMATIILIPVVALAAVITKSSGKATLIALTGAVVAGFTWWLADLPNAWGVDDELLPWMAIAISLLVFPKHLADARRGEVETPG